MSEIKIAVYVPKKVSFSIKNYVENVMNNLNREVYFYKYSSLEESYALQKKTNLFWFPNLAGGYAPSFRYYSLFKNNKVVVTLHGAAPFSVPSKLYYGSLKDLLKGEIFKKLFWIRWQIFKSVTDHIITVSLYAKEELSSRLNIPKDRITPIYHGVNTKIFKPTNKNFIKEKGYFLHISQYQPKKNVDRIIEAYQLIPNPKPKLVLIVPGYKKACSYPNIEIIRTPKNQEELALFYKNALAFIFPSLHETFGMPILEAMACGCPVITSNTTACAEVAKDAALLVNPYSTKEISQAMLLILKDNALRKKLIEKGLERIRNFSWHKSAQQHLKIFEEVCKNK